MVAMNSIQQHDVAKGKGHNELARANPTTSLSFVAKNPSPTTPSGGATIDTFESLMFFILNCTAVGVCTIDYPKLKSVYFIPIQGLSF